MSTRWESYCNTTTDLLAVEPEIDSYDRKRLLTGFVNTSGNLWTKGNAGYVERLWRAGTDLGAAAANAGAVDTDGEWYYDSSADLLTLYTTSNPNTTSRISAGRVWTTIKSEAVARASEFVRLYVNKPLIKRTGTAVQGESLRDWDDNIIRATALLAASYLVEPYEPERARALEMRAYDPTGQVPGILDHIKSGHIALWNVVTTLYTTGVPRPVSVNAETTGGIVETMGEATTSFDLIKIKIIAGGTITEGSASTVTYGVWVGDSTGLKTSQIITADVITCAYQPLAHGIWGRFSPGKYTTNDEWEIEVRGGTPEAGVRAGAITLTRL